MNNIEVKSFYRCERSNLLELISASTPGPIASVILPVIRDAERNFDRQAILDSLEEAASQARLLPPEEPNSSQLAQTLRECATGVDVDRLTTNGLAIYAQQNRVLVFHLPIAPQKHVCVAPNPFVLPLLSLVFDDSRFFIASIGNEHFRFFRATRGQVVEENAERLPAEFRDYHRSSDESLTVSAASAADDVELPPTNFDDLLVRVDQAVEHVMHGVGEPLVFCGHEKLFHRLREISTLPGLQTAFLEGDCDPYTAEEIHAKSWPLVEPIFRGTESRFLQSFDTLREDGRATVLLHEITALANAGKVDVLYVGKGVSPMGTVDPATGGSVVVSAEIENQWPLEDLGNAAAVLTLANGGTVSIVHSNRLPETDYAAAVLRESLFDTAN